MIIGSTDSYYTRFGVYVLSIVPPTMQYPHRADCRNSTPPAGKVMTSAEKLPSTEGVDVAFESTEVCWGPCGMRN